MEKSLIFSKNRMIYGGYHYLKSKNKNNKIYWDCVKRRRGNCRARAITVTDENNKLILINGKLTDHKCQQPDHSTATTELLFGKSEFPQELKHSQSKEQCMQSTQLDTIGILDDNNEDAKEIFRDNILKKYQHLHTMKIGIPKHFDSIKQFEHAKNNKNSNLSYENNQCENESDLICSISDNRDSDDNNKNNNDNKNLLPDYLLQKNHNTLGSNLINGDDPNELVHHLRILIESSDSRQNYDVEISSIINELRRADIIY